MVGRKAVAALLYFWPQGWLEDSIKQIKQWGLLMHDHALSWHLNVKQALDQLVWCGLPLPCWYCVKWLTCKYHPARQGMHQLW